MNIGIVLLMLCGFILTMLGIELQDAGHDFWAVAAYVWSVACSATVITIALLKGRIK